MIGSFWRAFQVVMCVTLLGLMAWQIGRGNWEWMLFNALLAAILLYQLTGKE